MPATFLRGYPLAFLTGACLLVLEITAGRLFAPMLGVSLYTWTSVIGVILAGMAAGQYLGGKLADLSPSTRTLGILLWISGITCLLIPTILHRVYLSGIYADYPAIPVIVGIAAVLFFLPSVAIGATSPLIVKLAIVRLNDAGRSIGLLYGLSTLGSLVGVFVAATVLIPSFGSFWVIIGIATTLILLAVGAGDLYRAPRTLLVLVVPLGASLMLLNGSRDVQRSCQLETQYYCIKWFNHSGLAENRILRVLALDALQHSYNDLRDPSYLHYPYLQIYAELTDHVAQRRPNFRALFIGGGGYTLPRHFEVEYPQASIDVIEIDPGVTEVAHEQFGLPRETRIRTFSADAREVIKDLGAEGARYDLIFGDAFHDLAVPYHLTTLEFNTMLRALTDDGGIYAVNVIDRLSDGLFLPSVIRTVGGAYPNVYLLSDEPPGGEADEEVLPYVVAGSILPLTQDLIKQVRGQGDDGENVTYVFRDDQIAELNHAGSVLLTDDFVPTDNLLAPVFSRQ